jgi:hypothetical protein
MPVQFQMHDLVASPLTPMGGKQVTDHFQKKFVLSDMTKVSIGLFRPRGGATVPLTLTHFNDRETELKGLRWPGIRIRMPDSENEYKDFIFGSKPAAETKDCVILGVRLVSG